MIVASASDSVVTLTAGWAAGVLSPLSQDWSWLRLRPDVGAACSGSPCGTAYSGHASPWSTWFSTTGAGQVSLLVLGPVIGTVGIGAVRGAQTLYGPYLTLLTGFGERRDP